MSEASSHKEIYNTVGISYFNLLWEKHYTSR